jgi:hypothetical protein
VQGVWRQLQVHCRCQGGFKRGCGSKNWNWRKKKQQQ